MNICILGTPRYGDIIKNGIAKATLQFVKYFASCGDKVYQYHYFSKQQYDNLYEFCLINKIDVAIWNMSTLNIKGSIKLPCPLISIWHSSPFFKISDVKLDKFHFNNWKYINYIIDYAVNFVHKLRNQLFFTYVAYKSNYLVLLSERYKTGFLPNIIFPGKIVSIPNSISLTNINIEKHKKNKTVLFVGRIRSEKRIDLLLKIWREVEKCNNDWNLIIVGDGPDANKYKLLSDKYLLNNVKWEGWSDDTKKYYSISSIICLTSEYEGFPMVLIEAQAYGCVPIVFGSFGSAYDIIENQYNGAIVEPFSVEEYSKQLLCLMNDAKMLDRMSNNAMLSVYKFEESFVMKQWRHLVDGVVHNNN